MFIVNNPAVMGQKHVMLLHLLHLKLCGTKTQVWRIKLNLVRKVFNLKPPLQLNWSDLLPWINKGAEYRNAAV